MTTTDRGELIAAIVGDGLWLFLAEKWQWKKSGGLVQDTADDAQVKKKAAGETAALIVLRL